MKQGTYDFDTLAEVPKNVSIIDDEEARGRARTYKAVNEVLSPEFTDKKRSELIEMEEHKFGGGDEVVMSFGAGNTEN